MSSSTVLIIEDDPPIRQLLWTVLMRRALTPVCAGDGESGLRLLQTGDYGAILLDLLLPEPNGFELLRHLACTRPELLSRVIVMTAAHESVWHDCPYIPRVRKIVRKPFDVAALVREIAGCCDGR